MIEVIRYEMGDSVMFRSFGAQLHILRVLFCKEGFFPILKMIFLRM